MRFDLDIDAYHGGPGISKTGLDDIARSPAIYHALHLDPARPARETKSGQLEGSLAHCAVLEPAAFADRYIVGPALNRNTKAWKEFVEANPSHIAIQPDQYDQAMRQADSVRKLPEVRQALDRGHAEASAFWIDEATGELCRCRPDWTHTASESGVILCDLKTCGDASPAEFARQIARKRYQVQDAFYSDGYAAASGSEVLAFVFIAVESTWPYASCALMLDDASRAVGRAAYRRNLTTYAECRRTDTWPGYSSAIELVSLPAWALNQEKE
ncbi:exonuclease VIII [Variovorax sp. PAMC 28711]|nr:exonuclease VIII [Variovorax sp. PAMC 28711]